MPDLYLNDKMFGTLKENELRLFLQECDSKNLKYLRIDDISWQLLPSLLDFTLLVKPLSISPVLDSFVQNLKTQLYRQGTNVILDRTPEMRTDLSDILDAQIFIDITENVPPSDFCVLNLYYSLRAKEKSMALIGGLMKDLDKPPHNLTYNIASYWRHLTSLKYYKILHSQIPSTLIEFNNSEIIKDSLHDIVQNMFDSIICLYGSKTSSSELDKLKECWETATTPPTRESQEPAKNKPPHPKGEKSDKKKSSVTANAKSRPTSALGRKQKQQHNKANILSPPGDGQINFFVRPNASTTQPLYNQNYLNKNDLTAPIIMRSTFRKPNSSEQNIHDQKKVEVTPSGNKTFLQSLKQLEQIINNE